MKGEVDELCVLSGVKSCRLVKIFRFCGFCGVSVCCHFANGEQQTNKKNRNPHCCGFRFSNGSANQPPEVVFNPSTGAGLPVFWFQEPEPAIRTRTEVEVPVSVVPFQLDLSPSQRNLRIGIERSDVRPGTGTVLLRIAQLSVVRIRSVRRPSVIWQVRHVVNSV